MPGTRASRTALSLEQDCGVGEKRSGEGGIIGAVGLLAAAHLWQGNRCRRWACDQRFRRTSHERTGPWSGFRLILCKGHAFSRASIPETLSRLPLVCPLCGITEAVRGSAQIRETLLRLRTMSPIQEATVGYCATPPLCLGARKPRATVLQDPTPAIATLARQGPDSA